MKFLADIEVEEGLKDSDGDLGSNGQVLSSTGTGTNWITSNPGDITGVTAGTGLSGGGTSGTVTLNLDLGELATGGTLIATDYLIAENGGVDNRQLISSIPLSIFNNNAGWTSNTGDITGVTAGTGLSGGGTSGTVTLTNSGVTSFNSLTGGVVLSAGTNIALATVGNTITINASGGGGGGIGGSTTATEIAFGSSTASEIDSDPGLTYTTQNGLSVKNTAGGGSSFITMRKGTAGNCVFEMQGENTPGSYSAKFFVDLTSTENTEITATGNLTLQNKVGTTKDIILNPTANVGIGNTSPDEKLDVTGRIKASNGVQVGAETNNSPTIADVGTFRYRTYSDVSFDYSAIDVCMQDGAGVGDYDWVNVVTKRW